MNNRYTRTRAPSVLVSWVLTIIMVLSLLPASALADELDSGAAPSVRTLQEVGTSLWEQAIAKGYGSFDTIDLCGGDSHLQGICVDDNMEYMYFSYTSALAKLDMKTGKVVASVGGFGQGSFGTAGGAHLGCLDYYDGWVYGSIEYKSPGAKFFLAAFDTSKMTELGMDCKKMSEGVNAILLAEPTYDFRAPMNFDGQDAGTGFATNEANNGHLFACSGIDGVTVGTMPGDDSGELYMIVAYGVYGGGKFADRYDNNYNVLQFYRVSDFWDADKKEPVGTQNIRFTYERGLSTDYDEDEMLHAADTLYVWTGNTQYGAQNIEYEWDSGDIVLYTYGNTTGFGKTMYVIDGSARPELKELQVGQHNTDSDEAIHTFAKETAECYINLNAYRFFDQDIELTETKYPLVKHAVLKCICGNPASHQYGDDECWGDTGVLKNEYPICSDNFYKSATTGIHWLDNDGDDVDYFYIADGTTTAGLYKRTTNANGSFTWSAVAVNAPPAEELLHYSFDNVSGGRAASSTPGTERYAAVVQNTTSGVGVDGTENGALAFNGFNYPAQPDRVCLDEDTIDYLNDHISDSYSYSFWAKLPSAPESDGNFNPFIGFYRQDGTYAGVFEVRWRDKMKYVINGIGTAAAGSPGDNGNYLVSGSTPVPGDEGWHFYTVTEDGGKGVVYLDGVQKASYSVAANHLTAEPFTDFIIGGDKAKLWYDRNIRGGLIGSIDDVTIYSGVLTEEQIRTAYAAVTEKETSGVSTPAMTIANRAKDTGFSPAYPVYDRTADAGKTLTVTAGKAVSGITGLTADDVTISGAAMTFTSAFLSSKACGLYELTVRYADGSSSVLKLTVTDGANSVAVLNYSLSAADVSATMVKDSSVYGVDAVTTAAGSFTANQNGAKNSALVFNGYDTQNPNYVRLSDDDAAWLNSVLREGYTVNFWANADGENGNKMSMLGFYAADARPVGVVETYEGEGSDPATTDGKMTVQADAGKDGASQYARSAAGIASTSSWNMYSMTYDDASGTLTLYVNGQQAAQTAVTGDITGQISQFFIGHTFAKYYKTTAAQDWTNRGGFKGAMADVQVYPAAMTADQVAGLYGNGPSTPAASAKPIVYYTMDGSSLNGDGTVTDASGYGNDGRWQNLTVVPGVDGKAGGALHFDANATELTRLWMGEDGIDYLNDAVDNQITVSFWFKSDAAGSNNTYSGAWSPLLGLYTTSSPGWNGSPGRFQLVAEDRYGSTVMCMNNYPSTVWPTDIRSGNGKSLNDGLWHYVVMTVDGERTETGLTGGTSQYRRFYIDGTVVPQQRAAYLTSDLLGGIENFEIGGEPYKCWADTNVRGRVTGAFDDVKIYNVPFEASDVAREYAKSTATSDGLYLPVTSFEVDMANMQDVKVTANNAQNLTSVTGLSGGYTFSGSTVTLDGDTLCDLGLGDHSLTLNFLNGSKRINVTVKDSRGYFTPSVLFFEKSSGAESVSFRTRATFTSSPVSVAADGLTADDYAISGNTITISRDFLMQQQPGAVEFTVTAPSGEKRTAVIHVTNSTTAEGVEPYPILYYTMDAADLANGTLRERSGHGIDAVAENLSAAGNKDGTAGGALFFNGYNDAELEQAYLDEAGVAYLNEAIDTSASISFWFSSDRITSNYMPVMGMFGADGRPAMMAQFRTASEGGERTGKGQATRPSLVNTPEGVRTHNTNFVAAASTVTMNSSWHHAVLVYDGSGASVYVDGALSATGAAAAGVLDAISQFRIGGMMNQYYVYTNKAVQPNGRYYGSLDEVKVYNTALTADNVAALYAMGVAGGLPEDPTGQKTVTAITLSTSPRTEYAVGEALDVSGGKLTVTYDDGSEKVMDLTADMVSGFDSSRGGTVTLTVSFGGQTTTFDVTVSKVLTAIQVTTLPRLTYGIGETLDVTSGRLTLTYDDGTTGEAALTADMVSGFDSSSAGSRLLTITYGNRTTTLGIVVGKELSGIAVSGSVRTGYTYGEALDVSGGKLVLTYDDGSDEEIALTAGMVYGFDPVRLGTQTLTVVYGNQTTTFDVTVSKALTALSVSGLNTRLTVGDSLNLTGAKVIQHFNDGSQETVALTEDMISGFDSGMVGTNVITITCGGLSTTAELTIIAVTTGGGGGGGGGSAIPKDPVPGSDQPGDDSTQNPFEDVPADAYYYDAVLWAAGNGVTSGTDATHFSPSRTCTRGQTVTFLWRAAGSPEPKSAVNPFTDVAEGSYCYKAVLWAVENGITNGVTATEFMPNRTVTRGQTVTFLWRAAGSSRPKSAANPFTDVAGNAYYANAVLWAVENGITNGVTATAFVPDQGCSRAQIVTFLYRHLAD
ncbi:LamG-like jellyroll fold domain-containing protein [Dysosmobacter sp.]|uniref:LamG-like jellyroll fold domain-containing protein n=1 Tax=Dysosmobacter sp. TaxID=2591382 RepID=UPI002A892D35|nr:LamG-like jellyroll fold domain-containing protein [Dysosmobacter sp.]MDY3282329.1 LamG-like jellyroll fold domain-containing protein [Dysosmobacter sp.]